MALPVLNENPEYEMIIPSKQEKVSFRPFLVKEQKVLMIAFESEDKNQILKAMLNTLDACIHSDIKVKDLPSFDIDYMFTQVRAKSVGETAEIKIKCKECSHANLVKVDLANVDPPKDIKKDIIIELTDKYSLEMKYPNYTELFGTVANETKETEAVMKFIISCMQGLLTDEERISMKDESLSEKQKFLESLNSEQFGKLTTFIQDLPKLSSLVEFNCESCNTSNTHELKGLEDFFL